MTAPSAPTERAPSGLAEVLRERRPEILERWRNAARGHATGALPPEIFFNHVPALLERLQKDVERAERGERLADDPAVYVHALERLEEGISLEDLVEEYVLLRKAIQAVWRPVGTARDLTELERLADAFDAVMARSVRYYTEAQNRTFQALDSISAAAISGARPEALLDRLLAAFVETSPAADAALVLLEQEGKLVSGADIGFGVALKGWLSERISALYDEGGLSALREEGLQAQLGEPTLREGGLLALSVQALKTDTHSFGVVVVASRTAPRFSSGDRTMLAALASRASAALSQLSLWHALDDERARLAALLEERERQRGRAELLSEASRRLFSSLDLERTLEAVTELVVPRVSDWCGVYLVDEQGELVPTSVAHADPAKAALARDAMQRYVPRKGAPYGSAHVAATGQAEVLEVLTDEMLERVADIPAHVELLRRLGLHSYMGVPMKARGRTIGVLVFVNAERQVSFGEEDLAFAEELAGRCALALENVRLYTKELRSRRVLEGVVSGMMDAVLVADREGRFFHVNRAGEQLFERPREELLLPAPEFSRLLGMHEPDDRPVERSITHEALRGHSVGPVERWIPRKNGTRRWLRLSATPLLDEEGCVEGAVIVCGDITAAKELEHERARAEEEERFLSESTRVLVESLDTETMLSHVARLAVPFLGDLSVLVLLDDNGVPTRVVVESVDPARAETFRRVVEAHGLDLESDNPAAEVLRGGRAEVVESLSPEMICAVFPAPEAARVIEALGLVSFAGFPLLARGRILGGLGFLSLDQPRELGARERHIGAELARRCALALDNARLYREAQEAIRIREHVLAVVSHDLKNPLAAVQMNAQLLKRSAQGEGGRTLRVAETIFRASERMTRMINDLADLRSIQRGRLAVERKPNDLAAVLEEAREEARAVAGEQEVTVAVRAEQELPVVECDRQRLLQVLSNLVSNAAKASPPGSEVEIGARASRDARTGANGEVTVWVKDRGHGIEPSEMSHLFEPYWRGRDAAYKGAGLGLAISRGIVQAHGGRIWAESQLGRGTTFFFTLPAARPPAGGER